MIGTVFRDQNSPTPCRRGHCARPGSSPPASSVKATIFSAAVSRGQRMVGTKPIRAPPCLVHRVKASADIAVFQPGKLPEFGRSEQTEQIEQGRFSRARRPITATCSPFSISKFSPERAYRSIVQLKATLDTFQVRSGPFTPPSLTGQRAGVARPHGSFHKTSVEIEQSHSLAKLLNNQRLIYLRPIIQPMAPIR